MKKICYVSPNKKRYSTEKDAQKAALSQDVPLAVYFCEDCSGWHLTKTKNNST